MKITVIKQAATTRKPQNFCPWIMDDESKTSQSTK